MQRKHTNEHLSCTSSSFGDPDALLPFLRFGKRITQHHLRKCPALLKLGLVSFLVLSAILNNITPPSLLLLVMSPSPWSPILEILHPQSADPALKGHDEIRSHGLSVPYFIKSSGQEFH